MATSASSCSRTLLFCALHTSTMGNPVPETVQKGVCSYCKAELFIANPKIPLPIRASGPPQGGLLWLRSTHLISNPCLAGNDDRLLGLAFQNAGFRREGSCLENAWLRPVPGWSLTNRMLFQPWWNSSARKRTLLGCFQAPEPGSPARAARAGVGWRGGEFSPARSARKALTECEPQRGATICRKHTPFKCHSR